MAVKQFPQADVNSWTTEQQIYAIPGMKSHPNILQYLAADVRGGNGPVEMEYWIVTEYHEFGSLYDYLKVLVPHSSHYFSPSQYFSAFSYLSILVSE